MGDDLNKKKTQALDMAISSIEKQFGKGSIMRLGSQDAVVETDSIPSGSLGLDIALGVGGIPRGRVMEIFGPESSGKTTLSLTMIASIQRAGGTAVFIDAEHALQPSYAQKIGVDIDNLHVSQPGTGEEGLEIADQLVIAVGTVKRHINNIYGKLDVRNRTQAVAKARELGIL